MLGEKFHIKGTMKYTKIKDIEYNDNLSTVKALHARTLRKKHIVYVQVSTDHLYICSMT